MSDHQIRAPPVKGARAARLNIGPRKQINHPLRAHFPHLAELLGQRRLVVRAAEPQMHTDLRITRRDNLLAAQPWRRVGPWCEHL